jgi:hypothetical protein
MAAVAAAALTPAPLLAGGGEPASKKPEPTLEELKKAVDKLTERIQTLETKVSAMDKHVGEALTELTGKVNGFSDKPVATDLNIARLQKELMDLRTELAQARDEMGRLRPRSSVSNYPANGAAAPPIGRVRLVNTWFEPVKVVLNQTAYDVPANQTKIVTDVPAGAFSYEVLGIQPRRDVTLASGEEFTVLVYPK